MRIGGFESRINAGLVRWIDEEIERLCAELGEGKAEDWPIYQRRCGYIAGLKAARQKVHDIETQLRR